MDVEDKAIVGYDSGIPISDSPQSLIAITRDLQREPGFVRVLKKIHHLHAVLVQVIPDKIDEFIQSVEIKDHIEYCVKDYLLNPSGYQDYVPNKYIENHQSQNNIKNLHNIRVNIDSGLGTKIALIDTGISPHPYLPAMKFDGCIDSEEMWHTSTNNISILGSFLHNLRKKESQFSLGKVPFDKKYIDNVKNEFAHLENETWKNWFSAYSSGRQKKVSPPIYSNVIGAIRKLSPDSWNFVNDTNVVIDSCGHGTAMAGIISGLPPYSYIEQDPAKKLVIEKYEPQVLGISPFSELVILKCYDESERRESSFLKMLDALEYCINIDLDVVYIGIGFSGAINPKSIKPLRATCKTIGTHGVSIDNKSHSHACVVELLFCLPFCPAMPLILSFSQI